MTQVVFFASILTWLMLVDFPVDFWDIATLVFCFEELSEPGLINLLSLKACRLCLNLSLTDWLSPLSDAVVGSAPRFEAASLAPSLEGGLYLI